MLSWSGLRSIFRNGSRHDAERLGNRTLSARSGVSTRITKPIPGAHLVRRHFPKVLTRDVPQAIGGRGTSNRCSVSSRVRVRCVASEGDEELSDGCLSDGCEWQTMLARSDGSIGSLSEKPFSSPYAEVGPHGKYFDVIVDDVVCLDGHGAILELRCMDTNGSAMARDLHFPMFMNRLAAERLDCVYGCEVSWLPPELGELDRLQDQNLRRIYVKSICMEEPGKCAMFQTEDEESGEIKFVDSTYERAMAMAMRYEQPLRMSRDLLLACNADFLSRMMLLPGVQQRCSEEGCSRVAEVIAEWTRAATRLPALQRSLNAAISSEDYQEAEALKLEIEAADEELDNQLLPILFDLQDIYTDYSAIFKKL
uniref:Uncharacterized protein n=1 Tax=Pyramimonas obovata TaxID=1411642 RepID=A0A7S0QTU3_9CHLO|mmetsp:Transcript_20227/g.44286  ORF Transcript_20227/g.44286 Transcript_20227/m.44286 type:complete len:367 (+) Transcript_20227:101-1201(+)